MTQTTCVGLKSKK